MENCTDNYCIKGETITYKERLVDALNYEEYLEKVYSMLEHGESGSDQHNDTMVHYTRMNMKRMERWNKTIQLDDEFIAYISEINLPIEFMVITEAWCGDAAHVLPIVQKIVDENPNFSMKNIFRDENPDIMDKYLTNGSRSIPVVIGLQKVGDEYLELFKWGPKPMPLMQKLHDFKSGKLDIAKGDYLKEIQMWYNQDKTTTIQKELFEVLKKTLEL